MSGSGFAVFASESGPSPRTLVDILDATTLAFPDAPALADDEMCLAYRELSEHVNALADRLVAAGVTAGDRVGIRIPSGTAGLYLGILAVLSVGAAYVPVDYDDPPDRADVVWAQAGVSAVVGPGLVITSHNPDPGLRKAPRPCDDAWVIFTSGSTGTPKGVAVTHRAAAAFVDAEARGCSARTIPSAQATAFWPRCRSRSTRHVRRCGSHGGTEHASLPLHVTTCVRERTSATGSPNTRSPSSRRCRHLPRCGRLRRWKVCGC
ncbi:AMP-binding enzyme [Kibdelosporangium aridum]|uniref:AMP-binding enzyme n=1 Tax=Kibdelosporangium aridum TaxID=2030 RepID=A0A1Y5Y7Y8_KIBAR|nr:AMP-binding enzyme [Kibdelosporangium aridum]